MKRWQKILLWFGVFILLAGTAGPFLVPVPELTGLVSESEQYPEAKRATGCNARSRIGNHDMEN